MIEAEMEVEQNFQADFKGFAEIINQRYKELAKTHEFYITDATDLKEVYLAAFPEGTNPVYITNTEHDCSACKNFIRNLGRVVAITNDYALDTIWNVPGLLGYPYNIVAKVTSKGKTIDYRINFNQAA